MTKKDKLEVIDNKKEAIIPILHDYQRAATNFVKQNKRVGLFLDMGLGKAISNDTKIISQNKGEVTVGDIEIDDFLYDRIGRPTKVLAVYPHENINAYEVTLKDGRKFTASDDHLVPYYSKGLFEKRIIRHKPLKDMFDDYKREYGTNIKYSQYKYSIPHNKAVEFNEIEHIIDPHAMGLYLASGLPSYSSLLITSNDDDVIYDFAFHSNIPHPNVKKKKSNRNHYTQSKQADIIKEELIRLNLHGLNIRQKDKYIPQSYIKDSIKNRRKLLTGMINARGTVITNSKGHHYLYASPSKQLIQDMQEVSLSLGYGIKVNEITDNNNSIRYQIRIYSPDILATTTKHEITLKDSDYTGDKHLRTDIVDIKQIENQDMTCFTVDNDENLFLINDYIVTHNTLVTLTALTELAVENKLRGHIMIIAPKRIAELTWIDEIEKWGHTRGARVVILAGMTKKKRDEAYDDIATAKPTIYIISEGIVRQTVERFPKEKWLFPNVVIDEAQSFKNPASVRFKMLKTILPYTDRLIELTGTPAPNTLIDLWALIYMLDGGARLGRNITMYRAMHFNPGPMGPQGFPYMWFLKDGHEDIIHDSIKDVAISMTKEDYLDIPDVTHNIIELKMSKKERKIYEQLKEDKVLPLMDGGAIESSNAAVLSGALLQLANGAIYADEDRSEVIELHQHKLDALEYIEEGAHGQSILCWYWYKHDLARLQKRFGDRAETFDGTAEQLERWNKKEIPLLFAQPQSAGHGLNFQHGGHIMVFFSVPRSLELYEQSIARLHRTGQTEAVIVHYLRMTGTVEDQVITQLRNKQLTQNALLDAVKANLTELSD